MGIALLRDDELTDWEMRSFPGAWSRKKCQAIASAIESLITDHAPGRICIQLPSAAFGSNRLQMLTKALGELETPKGVTIRCCSLTELKKRSGQKKRVTNRMLQDHTLKLYPELFREHRKEQQYKRPYYARLFEAVMAARVCSVKRR